MPNWTKKPLVAIGRYLLDAALEGKNILKIKAMDLKLYIERIEQYESGAMATAGREEFERELANNAELREALTVYRQANEVMELEVENKLRSQLNGWAAEDTRSSSGAGRVVAMRSTWMRWAVAAGLALLLGWLGMRWAGNQYSDQALYAGYYEKPADSVFRSGSAGDNPLQAGFRAFQEEKWAVALAFFRTIPPENERYGEAQYYLGHVALQLKKYDTAIAAFQAVVAAQDFKFQEKAEWNLLLAYVAAGRSSEPAFVALLDRVAASSEHSFSGQAGELKGKLGAVWRKL